MKTRKTLAMILSLLLLVSLLAGCGGNTTGGNTAGGNSGSDQGTVAPDSGTAPTDAPDAPTDAPDAPPVEDSPYNFAAGNYEVNEEGYPTERYVYELPLSTTDEVLTYWTTCYSPELIPEEGWGEMDTWKGLREMTGVNIEYNTVSWQSRDSNFAVLLASDDLDDILAQGNFFYSGSLLEAVEEAYFVNLAEYTDYMPCYLYECYEASKANADILNYMYDAEGVMSTMYGRYDRVTPQMGLYARQDWLDELGLGKSDEIRTFDQLTGVLEAFKTRDPECWPLHMFDIIDLDNYMFTGYNTYLQGSSLSSKRVVDGKVEFCGSTDDDGLAMAQVNAWYNAGYINPNYGSHSSTFDGGGYAANDTCGIFANVASTIATVEAGMVDPDAMWEPVPRLLLQEDQVVHFGQSNTGFHYGSANVSATCENVELAVTWLDFWFSKEGSDYTNWGPQGFMWDYDENGNRRLTDFILNHEIDSAVVMCVYGCSHLIEFCLLQTDRYYAFDGGERVTRSFDVWTVENYDGAYDFPTSIKLDDDANAQAVALMADLNTFYVENLVLFIDGSTPMSQWDTFQTDLERFHLSEVEALWQEAYDAYMAA